MRKRITLAVVAAFAATAILTGCGNDEDDEDCEGAGQLEESLAMSFDALTSGGSGGRSSSSGGSTGGSSRVSPAKPAKPAGKPNKNKPAKPKVKPVKIDDDAFEDCDD